MRAGRASVPDAARLLAMLCLALTGCASSAGDSRREAEQKLQVEATRAWLEEANLETMSRLTVAGTIRIRSSNLRYATIEVDRRFYLLEVDHDCPALLETGGVQFDSLSGGGPDLYRQKRITLRAGYDSIRLCRIRTIYAFPDSEPETDSGDSSPSKDTADGARE